MLNFKKKRIKKEDLPLKIYVAMAELVDALVSDASGATRVSSNLISHTKKYRYE